MTKKINGKKITFVAPIKDYNAVKVYCKKTKQTMAVVMRKILADKL